MSDDKNQNISDAVSKLSLSNKNGFKERYDFWDTQPVLKVDAECLTNGPIDPEKPISEYRSEPYSLPPGFCWDDIHLDDERQLTELYTLLNENYVEDDDNMFRFDYSPSFLRWALQPPGWHVDWSAGIRAETSRKLVGFISAVPAEISVHGEARQMVEINFLCVHKRLRSKRVAPVLIREITRRVNRRGVFQAVYTGGVLLPRPTATCTYWHRSLNPKKLIECRFSQLGANMTMKRTLKLYSLPDRPQTPGFRAMTAADLDSVFVLLTSYLSNFKLHPMFRSVAEMAHWLMPREGVISTFVVAKGAIVTDLCSFYSLPSTVIDNPRHSCLNAAYSYYNVASIETGWTGLMRDCMIQARIEGHDVFNALDLMENDSWMRDLRFGRGDGRLHYYLYNWGCPSIGPAETALVLQ